LIIMTTPNSDTPKSDAATGSTPSGHYVAGDSALASKPTEPEFPETKVKVTQPTAFTDEQIEEEVVKAIKTVYDPEIPVNVFDLGLIYGIQINPDRTVLITMTLTTPNCPAAGFLPGQVEARVRHLPMVEDARVEITFDPPFSPDMMSDEAKLELGFL
jgi:FeS assembly SUF system protein